MKIILLILFSINVMLGLNLNSNEKQYLEKNKNYTVCTRYKHYPIDGVQNEELIGITGAIYNEIASSLSISFEPIESKSNEEFRRNIHLGKCDLISIAKNTYFGFDDYLFTTPILKQYYVSVGSIENKYLHNIPIQNDHIFYVKDRVHQEVIEYKYPMLDVIVESNIDKIMDSISKNTKSHFILTTYAADQIILEYGPDKFKIDDIFDGISA